jgi:transposase-like protein
MGRKQGIAADVKADIIRRVKEEGIPVAQAAKDHGVSDQTIYNWLGGGIKGAPSWGEFSKLKKERDEFLRIIGDLTVQLSTAQKKSW